MKSPFSAWRYVSTVDLIDPAELASQGVRLLLVDRDNTLVPRDTRTLPPQVCDWVRSVKDAGIAFCLLSNNFHTQQIAQTAAELGCQKVDHAMKPAPIAVWHAMAKMGVGAEQTVVVGDQVFTDLLAGTLSGVRTILVRPQSTTDLWYTQIFRFGERVVLGDVRFEGE
jgi:HAD superfamily phosphatase (TIGR01668 family)